MRTTHVMRVSQTNWGKICNKNIIRQGPQRQPCLLWPQTFLSYLIFEWAEMRHADVSWPLRELIWFWSSSVDFPHFVSILTLMSETGQICNFWEFSWEHKGGMASKLAWISGTKHLKNYSGKVSISPDLPPVIRPLKDELMETRAKLPTDIKQKSRLKFLTQWPFVELRIQGQSPKRPSSSLSSVTSKMLSIEPLLRLREFD